MLDHMSAEQVGIRQRIQGGNQCYQQKEYSKKEKKRSGI
jgi:hypothetical protein